MNLEVYKEASARVDKGCRRSKKSMVVFDAAQRAIEETQQLLNDLAHQSSGQRRTPE